MNAKQEFTKVVEGSKVICASIQNGGAWYAEPQKQCILKTGYTEEDYKIFLESIDFNYDNGYGGQELFGTIWCENGVWMNRGEYDGSEWWETNKYPEIPENLK